MSIDLAAALWFYTGVWNPGDSSFYADFVAHPVSVGMAQPVNVKDGSDHPCVARHQWKAKVYSKKFLSGSKKRAPGASSVCGGVSGVTSCLAESAQDCCGSGSSFTTGSGLVTGFRFATASSRASGLPVATTAGIALLLSLYVVFAGSPVLAQKVDPDSKGYLDYDEISHRQTAGILQLRAQKALWAGDYHRAIRLCEQSMEHNTDDADTHVVYAEALESKLKHQTEKDPEVFRKCVEAWLKVYRNQVGEEKGMTAKGIGIGMDRFYADDERGGKAKLHLIKLTGYVPKFWETNDKYLTRVLAPATTSVTATIRPSASTGSTSPSGAAVSTSSSGSTGSQGTTSSSGNYGSGTVRPARQAKADN